MPNKGSAVPTRRQRRQIQADSRKSRPQARPSTNAEAAAARDAGVLARLLPWLAALLAIAIYAGAMSYPFLSDDTVNIVGNPGFQSWKYVPYYFTHNIWDQPGKGNPSNYYRPLGEIDAILMYHLFQWRSAGWHAVVILFHALATLLFYLLAVRTLKDRTLAGFAALIFAVYPVHVESVAWVGAGGEPQYSMFFLAAVLCYLKWREQRKTPWFVASLACCSLSLLAKESAVVLVVMIFLYEWLYQRDQNGSGAWQRAAWISLPYVALTAAYLGLRAYALHSIIPIEVNHSSRADILLSVPETLWFYLSKMIWPLPVSLFHPLQNVTELGEENFWWPLTACLIVFAGLYFWSRRNKAAGIASVWLLLPLAAPVFAIAHFPPNDMVHDRYLYLASVGAALLIALALQKLKSAGRTIAGAPLFQLIAVLLLAGVMGAITVQEQYWWSGDMPMYTHAAEISPHNLLAAQGVARATEARPHDPKELLAAGERILKVDPDAYETLVGVGRLKWEMKDFDGALPLFKRAHQVRPGQYEPDFWLGAVYLEQKQYGDAEAAFREAIRLAPNAADNHVGLGMVYENEGKPAEARSEYQTELQAHPDSARARERLAVVEARLKGASPAAPAPKSAPGK